MIGWLLAMAFAATCPPGASLAARPTAPCATADGRLLTPRFAFEPGRSTLSATGQAVVRSVAAWLKAHDIQLVEVQGHLDAPERYSIKLSDNRARAVRDGLIAAGINASRVVARGYGQERPLFDPRVPEQNRLNRRIELLLVTWGEQDHPRHRADCAAVCATEGRCRSLRRTCVVR